MSLIFLKATPCRAAALVGIGVILRIARADAACQIDADCEFGNFCKVDDGTCHSKQCSGPAECSAECDDGNPCTRDYCSYDTGLTCARGHLRGLGCSPSRLYLCTATFVCPLAYDPCDLCSSCFAITASPCPDPNRPVSCPTGCCPAGHQCGVDGCVNPTPCSRPIAEYVQGDDDECVAVQKNERGEEEIVTLSAGVRLCRGVRLQCTRHADPHQVVVVHVLNSQSLDSPGASLGTIRMKPGSTLILREEAYIEVDVLRGKAEFESDHSKTELDVHSQTLKVKPIGTIFDVAYDEQTQLSTVRVQDGSVEVTPTYFSADPLDLSMLQARAAPFTLHAGEEVVVGRDTVGPVTLLCLPGQCDDAEACTLDTCTPAACGHDLANGFDAVCSACRGGLGSRVCASQPVPATVGKRVALACTLRDQAGTKTPKAAQKLLRRAKKSLRSAAATVKKAAKRHKRPISSDCAAEIAGVLGSNP